MFLPDWKMRVATTAASNTPAEKASPVSFRDTDVAERVIAPYSAGGFDPALYNYGRVSGYR